MKKIELLEVEMNQRNLYLQEKVGISWIKSGYYWYEDDTFSAERDVGKKIKAIVELVWGNTVFGDLTASELFDIQEKDCNWNDAKKYIEEFCYPCKDNEKIVWHHTSRLKRVYNAYYNVKKTLEKLGKSPRRALQWSSSSCGKDRKELVCFDTGFYYAYEEVDIRYIRPVIAMKIS